MLESHFGRQARWARNLGIGLRTLRERRTLLGGLETKLAARDAEQTALIATRLGELLADGGVELRSADDQRPCVALASVGLELASLRTFVGGLVALAKRLAALPPELPAPAVIRDHLQAWTQAARSLRGQIRPSALTIELTRDELRVAVACDDDDDGQVRATQLVLDPKLALPTRHHLIWAGDTELPEHELALALSPSASSIQRLISG
ncbi:hypothetical protein ENSA5_01940 [Enhygromyxa salina]|uniref:Uncharacterized protein n=1 Tax=Enhygromyxa salina TaxID=215803 RepID=A0A2S9YKP5_9BACT|nr:hypothetical protein [Enhygromyxa salina]PRQ05697.1 hypothetical protein ENSA5_01940 [Enhygromyxa salina]